MPLFKKPPQSQRQTEERLKLAASGLQLFALAVVAADFIGPFFNASPGAAFIPSTMAVIGAGLAEGAAFVILRYIPANAVPSSSQEPPNA